MLRAFLFVGACFASAQGASLKGKVGLITGASSGIGEVAAKELAKHGMKVVLTARRKDRLLANVEAIIADGGIAAAKECDVTDGKSVAAAFAFAEDTYGGVDFVFANAGFDGNTMRVSLEDEDDETLAAIHKINVIGSMYTLKSAVKAFRKRSGGTIAFSSSIAGLIGGVGHAALSSALPKGTAIAYTSSKTALDAIVEGAHGNYAGENINVYGLNIAMFLSEMTAKNGFVKKEGVVDEAAFNPIFKKSFGDPVHIAQCLIAILDGSSLWPAGSHIVNDNDATFDAKHMAKSRMGVAPGEPQYLGWPSPEELLKVAKDVRGAPYTKKAEL